MRQTINLLEYLNFNEDLSKSAILPKGILPIEDERLIDKLSLDDKKWNELFKEYDSTSYKPNFCVVKVTDENGKSGYVTGVDDIKDSVKAQSEKDLFRVLPEQDKNKAQLFNKNDVKNWVSNLEKNKNFIYSRNSKLKLKFDLEDVEPDIHPAQYLFNVYFWKLCGEDDEGLRYIERGRDQIYRIIRNLKYPLAGDYFLRLFSESFKNKVNNNWISNKSVLVINDLLANDIFEDTDFLDISDFKTSLIYNPNIYTEVSEKELINLFRLYDNGNTNLKPSNTKMVNWQTEDPKQFRQQLPRQLFLKPSKESDTFYNIVMDPESADKIEDLHMYGISYRSDPKILTSVPRPYLQAQDLFLKLGGKKRDDKKQEVMLNMAYWQSNSGRSGTLPLDTEKLSETKTQFNTQEKYKFVAGDKIKIYFGKPEEVNIKKWQNLDRHETIDKRWLIKNQLMDGVEIDNIEHEIVFKKDVQAYISGVVERMKNKDYKVTELYVEGNAVKQAISDNTEETPKGSQGSQTATKDQKESPKQNTATTKGTAYEKYKQRADRYKRGKKKKHRY